jgi:aldose 1-epimerase
LVTAIQAPPALDEIRHRPSWWGIPLLFPFPGTIPQGEYEFEGRKLRLGRPEQPIVSEGKEFPGARRDYHGFVMNLPWEVHETAATDEAAVVTSALDSRSHPEAHEGFPFPYRVEATYTLDANGLRLDFAAVNVGDGRLPFGFGAHPFFKLPLGLGGSAQDCLLRVPAAARWNGRALRGLLERYPDGRVPHEAWSELRPAVPPDLDLRVPRPFEPGKYNGMYTELELAHGMVEAFVRDPVNGLETVMRATPNFPSVVVWSPPGRDEVCFEPWICPSNVFNLAARGVPRHGLIVLEPGEHWEATMWIALRPAD